MQNDEKRPKTESEPPPATHWGDGALLFLGLALLRIAQLLILGRHTGGVEFTDDASWLALYMEDPLLILAGREVDSPVSRFIHVYPPLLPPVLAAIGAPLAKIAPTFWALRANFVLFELIAFPFLWDAVSRRFDTHGKRQLVTAAYIVLPAVWMTNVVMCQEESLGFLVMAIVVWLVARGKRDAAVVVCSLGVAAAKIYFLVPLLGLVLGPVEGGIVGAGRRTLLAAAPIAAAYALPAFQWFTREWGFPLGGFTAKVEDSTTLWALVPSAAERVVLLKWLSAPVALIAGLAPLFVAAPRGTERDERWDLIRLTAAMLLGVFVSFYQIQAEYYVLLVPAFLVALRPAAAIFSLFMISVLTWSVNLSYGVRVAAASGAPGGKAAFVELYQSRVPIDPQQLQVAATVALAAVTIWLAVHLARRA